ncbi:hypothetical protein GOP47_0002889 [Adiantum capillus-veneris]|uniref:Uncharacterized protein n=1 Tax=Adiantum capillus-veneris TaxID=13818 RepID=A0A9D4VAX9_ADICA|nr:hypothetical protein GOP47_0002889 [Adiantum capillus-veneris]
MLVQAIVFRFEWTIPHHYREVVHFERMCSLWREGLPKATVALQQACTSSIKIYNLHSKLANDQASMCARSSLFFSWE